MEDRLFELRERNLQARHSVSTWLLMCFECYTVWQFGVIFFSGRSFTVFGRTPLPTDVSGTALAAVLGGLTGMALLVLFQPRVKVILRIGGPAALVCTLLLFFPLPEPVLVVAVYGQVFLCLAMFGACHGLIVFSFSEETTLRQAVVTTLVTAPFVAIIQNEAAPLSFWVFNLISVALLSLFSLASWRLPAASDVVFIHRAQRRSAPVALIAGLLFWVFSATLVMEMALVAAEGMRGGVSITYLTSLVGGLVFLLLWKRARLPPLRLFTLFLAVTCVGMILFAASGGMPQLLPVACALTGFGFIIFAMVSYIGQWVFRLYPSRFLMPCFMGAILAAITAHSVILDLLRDHPAALYAVFGAAAAILLLLYLLLEPYLDHMRREKPHISIAAEPAGVDTPTSAPLTPTAPPPVHPYPPHPFDVLTVREREVAELLLQGYTGGGIAKHLYVSENTVASHRRELYRKLDIHSKRELFELAGK